MDSQFRSRLIAAIILLIVVCSAFSVSPASDCLQRNGTEAALAEALCCSSTVIRNEYMENLTVYIDSRNEVFGRVGPNRARSLRPGERHLHLLEPAP